MSDLAGDHYARVEDALRDVYSLTNLHEYIAKNTYLNGKRFSYDGHEFQRTILADAAETSICIKCAQVGLSEILARWCVCACVTQEGFTIIYTFPTTSDAEKFCRTRLDPTIAESPKLAFSVSSTLNNAEVKQFGRNSFLYFRGTVSETAALSVPANAIIHDEVDKSNLVQMSVYVSRLRHQERYIRKLFSTPTVDKYGISKEAETARRMRQVHTCDKCNHRFLPDYFEHIKIPGYNDSLDMITKSNIKDIRYKEAKLLCPKCGREPAVHPELVEWVCENNEDNYPANAWYVTPFSARKIMTPAKLVFESTQYAKYSEFMNQGLGLTAEDINESITEDDLESALVRADLFDGSIHYMGCDMGTICHISIGRVVMDGDKETLLIVHRESVVYGKFEQRRVELCAKFRVVVTVLDAQPYVDMVTRIVNADAGAFASVFTTGTPGTMFSIKEQEPDNETARLNMRRLNVTRTLAFDYLMTEIKARRVKVQRQDEIDHMWKEHHRSLKRIGKLDRTQEIVYVWEKTDGKDHYHFSSLYLMLATKLRGIISGHIPMGQVPLLKRFRNQSA